MQLSLALSPTPVGRLFLAALIFAGLKLISFLLQIVLARGDNRNLPRTAFFRTVYLTGKITPILSVACFLAAALLLHDRANSWFLGVWMVFVALLAAYVVRLRQRGRFYGMLDLITRNRQSKP